MTVPYPAAAEDGLGIPPYSSNYPIVFLTKEVMGKWLAWTQTHARSSKKKTIFPGLSLREERLLTLSVFLRSVM
jgi:hypothetical protein